MCVTLLVGESMRKKILRRLSFSVLRPSPTSLLNAAYGMMFNQSWNIAGTFLIFHPPFEFYFELSGYVLILGA